MRYNIRTIREDEDTLLDILFAKLLQSERLYDTNIKDNLTINGFFKKRTNDKDAILLVADVDNKIVGYIYGYVHSDNKIKIELESYIESLFVEEEYRNQGIGQELLNRFIEESKDRGVKYIFIENKVGNETAQFLYKKLNFNIFIENRRKEI